MWVDLELLLIWEHQQLLLAAGGDAAPGEYVASTEQWNGSAWTELGDLNTNRSQAGGSGLYTDSIMFGGDTETPAATAKTEAWNGSSWTEVNDLSVARIDGANAGTSSTLALYAGGRSPTKSDTEEWSFPSGPHLKKVIYFYLEAQR